MIVTLTDPGCSPMTLEEDGLDWNKVYNLLKKYNCIYTYLSVTDGSGNLILRANRKVGYQMWNIKYYSHF